MKPPPRQFTRADILLASLYCLGFTAAVGGTLCYSWKLALVVAGFLLLSAFWRLTDRGSRP